MSNQLTDHDEVAANLPEVLAQEYWEFVNYDCKFSHNSEVYAKYQSLDTRVWYSLIERLRGDLTSKFRQHLMMARDVYIMKNARNTYSEDTL